MKVRTKCKETKVHRTPYGLFHSPYSLLHKAMKTGFEEGASEWLRCKALRLRAQGVY